MENEYVQDVEAYLNEPVKIRLFRDNDRYRDRVYVAVNGRNCLSVASGSRSSASSRWCWISPRSRICAPRRLPKPSRIASARRKPRWRDGIIGAFPANAPDCRFRQSGVRTRRGRLTIPQD